MKAKSFQLSSFADISKAAEDADKKDTENEKEAAATKIQAAFRGHYARKSLRPKRTEERTGSEAVSTEEPADGQLQEEFPSDNQGERDRAHGREKKYFLLSQQNAVALPHVRRDNDATNTYFAV